MKPGDTARPEALILLLATAFRKSPIATMRSPESAMSATNQGAPVPSTIRPPLMMKSYLIFCAETETALSKIAIAARRHHKWISRLVLSFSLGLRIESTSSARTPLPNIRLYTRTAKPDFQPSFRMQSSEEEFGSPPTIKDPRLRLLVIEVCIWQNGFACCATTNCSPPTP